MLGAWCLVQTVIPWQRNADYIKATEKHNQHLANLKAKHDAPLEPVLNPPPQPETDTVPSGPDLDSIIVNLLEGNKDQPDLDGDVDVTEAMFAFLASAGIELSPSGIVTPKTLEEATQVHKVPSGKQQCS